MRRLGLARVPLARAIGRPDVPAARRLGVRAQLRRGRLTRASRRGADADADVNADVRLDVARGRRRVDGRYGRRRLGVGVGVGRDVVVVTHVGEPPGGRAPAGGQHALVPGHQRARGRQRRSARRAASARLRVRLTHRQPAQPLLRGTARERTSREVRSLLSTLASRLSPLNS